ncbi:ABC transporter permease [Streptomyces sp. 3MP-14]|uniref:ABC transporter permease n=1 Tax=Streptomyces mimosae TaxID=2586635 RepID=A0A5N6A3S9_9ACTN|nr:MULTISPECIES: ABC transporter permease [Streptomyces]KAB8162902.1 ABC transporter permease [Streptomyces mimosae]KAB8179115.1 ABC transporter permease [Streptomyces sp. 3MP-14]
MLLPTNATLGVVVAVLLVAAAGVAAFARLTRDGDAGTYAWPIVRAGLRAVAQLAVVSLVIGWIVGQTAPQLGFVALMFAVASFTAGRRITSNATWRRAGWAILAGVAPVVSLVLATGLVRPDSFALVPVAGILIGGSLTSTTLAGRRALEELEARHGEVEAALALGLSEREARMEIGRTAAASALVPGLDQTRTVGLVTLPGAFVGILLGGASPMEAGAVQLFVLIGLMAVQSVSVATVLELIARGHLHRDATER